MSVPEKNFNEASETTYILHQILLVGQGKPLRLKRVTATQRLASAAAEAEALLATDNVGVWPIETVVLQLLGVTDYIHSNHNLCTYLSLVSAADLDTDGLA